MPTLAWQVARGRAIIPANKRHLELEPTIIGVLLPCLDTAYIFRVFFMLLHVLQSHGHSDTGCTFDALRAAVQAATSW